MFLDEVLKLATVGDEVRLKGLAGCGMAYHRLRDLYHAAGLGEVECGRREEKHSLGHGLLYTLNPD